MPTSNVRADQPLGAHPAFAASNFDDLSAILESRLNAKFVKLPRQDTDIVARANAFSLSQSELWYCAYGMPLSVRFPEGDYLRLQFQHKGVGATWAGREMIPVTERQACISSAAVEIDFAEDFEQVVWRIPRGRLEQKLATLTGRPIGYALEFQPTLDLTDPQAGNLRLMFNCLIQAIDSGITAASSLVLVELEQAFIATFLATAQHSGRALLDETPAELAPWQVRRAESYIAAHWDQPITIEDLAKVTETSTRSLFRTFKASRGCSPLEFVRQLRLQHARRMLKESTESTKVTDVALACGFNDLGRFAKEYVAAFGERPSTVLARRRGSVFIQRCG
jgi:AraC-like DNA-binding protein